MRFNLLFVICYFILHCLHAEIKVCSWNLKDFGDSKSLEEIEFIAATVKDFDVIAIQEVVAGEGGPQAIARLWDSLNRKGSKWDYSISDPTSKTDSSNTSELYAYIWKTSKLLKVGEAWLEQKYSLEIDREPFYIQFKSDGEIFTLVNFHAITKDHQPETEIKYFKYLPSEYPNQNLIFCGDFNCPESHTVFNPLKSMGYKPVLFDQKTSIRQKSNHGDFLASEFDNVFYNTGKVTFVESGIIPFFDKLLTFDEAKNISDHVPVYFQFSLK